MDITEEKPASNPRSDEPVWAVILVHGVGVTSPGNTLEWFVPNLLRLSDGGMVEEEPFEVRCLVPPEPRSPDADAPPPAELNAPPRKSPTDRFPMHLRRVRITHPREGTPGRAVFAEVYWADLSSAGAGLWQLLLLSFTLVFHLSFLADQAATYCGLCLARVLRPALYFASWLLCGPTAALTGFLLYVLLTQFAAVKLAEGMHWMADHPSASGNGAGAAVFVISVSAWFWFLSRRLDRGLLWLLAGAAGSAVMGWLASLGLAAVLDWVNWTDSELFREAALNRLALVFLRLGLGLAVIGIGLGGWAWKRDWSRGWLIALAVLGALGLGLAASFGPIVAAPAGQVEGTESLTRLPTGLGLGILCIGLSYWAWSQRWDRVWLVLAVAGASSLVWAYTGLLGRVNETHWTDPHRLIDIGMIGYGIAGASLAGVLYLWGLRREWGGSWILFYACGAVSGFAFVALAGYRLCITPDEYKASCLGRYILARVPGLKGELDPFGVYLAALVCAIRACFFALAVVILLASLFWLAGQLECWIRSRLLGQKRFRSARHALNAALGATVLQEGLWSLLIPPLGLLALTRLAPDQIAGNLFGVVWSAYFLDLCVAALVAALALVVWIWRWLWVRSNPGPYSTPQQARGIPRLLIHGLILYPLIFFSVIDNLLRGWSFWVARNELPASLQDRVNEWSPTIVAGTAGLITLAYYAFQDGLWSWLHIVTDIVSHFYRRRQPNPFRKPSPREKPNDFVTEQQIEARARRVFEEVLLNAGNVTDLTILAHSQGTVIALHSLWLKWTQERLRRATVISRAPLKVRFVTMGSPFTHLYQYYFPRRYPALFDGDAGTPAFNDQDWFCLKDNVEEWANVYRVDDFVGTNIDGNEDETDPFPKNLPISAGGHTDYWSDNEALSRILYLLPGPLGKSPP